MPVFQSDGVSDEQMLRTENESIYEELCYINFQIPNQVCNLRTLIDVVIVIVSYEFAFCVICFALLLPRIRHSNKCR